MGALNPTALSDRSFGDKLLEPDGNFEKKGKRAYRFHILLCR